MVLSWCKYYNVHATAWKCNINGKAYGGAYDMMSIKNSKGKKSRSYSLPLLNVSMELQG